MKRCAANPSESAVKDHPAMCSPSADISNEKSLERKLVATKSNEHIFEGNDSNSAFLLLPEAEEALTAALWPEAVVQPVDSDAVW
mmetsp:Transcript_91610/g.237415  ORF Transcript_91610/g.237415 Transcript_91610/m.237415 type:complete len:85 (+) Transcript_91610:911-1165(+)|eukprot:CAMPEP_0115551464 /NCGR_PEP_ID=MMETSP0271-20121206/95744_1 /TAXON_ID=71861 /ORGANISM="Scrippsiella trochoidea, Strain CCMP3099" /LENGTH=84 /DNA_ID=CAMNT_0002985065 /DNA_START=786 /DNA_END=1040 /DNA_ORIENTATION=-